MGLSIQTKLLRALREKAFERVGGAQTIHIDSRVIAATTTNLAEAVRRGRFREDLHHRLGATTIPLPPLRERGGDLLLLIGHFLDRYRFVAGHPPAAIAPAAVAVMERYSWPGNVRELETTIERAVTLARGGLITPAHLGTLGDQPGRPGP